MLESGIEAYLLRQIKKHYPLALVKKVNGMGWRGWNDRLIIFEDGAHHWIELKRPKNGEFEPLQLRTHRELRRRNCVVRVLHTRELVDLYLAELREWGPSGLSPTQPY